MRVPLLFFCLLFSSTAFCIDKAYMLTPSQLEDLVIEGNGVKLNNFTIAEKRAWLGEGMVNIEVSFSARNRLSDSRHFAVMLVGMTDKGILWSMALEPLMSTIAENTTETVQASIYIAPGTLQATTKIWLRVIGDF